MRIVICVPQCSDITGNMVTARRYRQALCEYGHQVVIRAVSEDGDEMRLALMKDQPELLLLLHAYKTGKPWLCLHDCSIPALVLLSGTDVNDGLHCPQQREIISLVLQQAAAVLIQNPLLEQLLRRDFPHLCSNLYHLPPAALLGEAEYPLRSRHEIADGTVVLLCAAGIRPVKGLVELIEMAAPLESACRNWLLAFCGPPLDDDYAQRFFAAVDRYRWATYLGIIPQDAMASVLRAVDVVVNNSFSEGLSNVLVEAACLGRPLLARDIPGNRPLVKHGVNGLLYNDSRDFVAAACALIDKADLRRQLSVPDDTFSSQTEARILNEICCRAGTCRP